jgi:hypothetical protein
MLPAEAEVRIIEGAEPGTRASLLDAFARAWQFPSSFTHRNNADAFNDWIRDLDNLTNLNLTKPPASGYFTEIFDAHTLLAEQTKVFQWFARSIPLYREYYRDELDPPAAFGLLLSAPDGRIAGIRQRWLAVGVQIATVTL